MQAIKLHQTSKPYLGKESYLVPIFNWNTSKIIVKRWISYLDRQGGEENQSIEYITLVKIPDKHLVSLSLSPTLKGFNSPTYMPLSHISNQEKSQVSQWVKTLIKTGSLERHNLPELILGASLSRKYVKWTKQIDSLYRREKYVKSRKNNIDFHQHDTF